MAVASAKLIKSSSKKKSDIDDKKSITSVKKGDSFVSFDDSSVLDAKEQANFREQTDTKKIICFDTETTGLDSSSDEILQFGAVDENGETLMNVYIRPTRHDRWVNAMYINGITPQMVSDAPLIESVSEEIAQLFDQAEVIIGYNVEFDLAFLKKAGIKISNKEIHDVMVEAAPIIGKYNAGGSYSYPSLEKTAACYEYKFKAHDALEDAKATLYCYYKVKNKEAPSVDPETVVIKKRRYFTEHTSQTTALVELTELISDVISDNELSESEVLMLKSWMIEHDDLSGNYPYDRIYQTIEKALEDGVLENEEKNEMFSLFNRYISPLEGSNIDASRVSFDGMNVVLTGDFSYGPRNEVEKRIQELGGTIKNGVSGKVQYVIVGDLGSPDWSYGQYGGKVKKL